MQNEQVKKISSWAAILFAPSFVAGIYGMNFDVMPELQWSFGYPMAIGLMAGTAALMYGIFKKQGLALAEAPAPGPSGRRGGSTSLDPGVASVLSAALPGQGDQPSEGQDKDRLDQDHEPQQQPLACADEGYGSDHHQDGSQGQGVDGEADGHLCAADSRAEAEAQGFAPGVAPTRSGPAGVSLSNSSHGSRS